MFASYAAMLADAAYKIEHEVGPVIARSCKGPPAEAADHVVDQARSAEAFFVEVSARFYPERDAETRERIKAMIEAMVLGLLIGKQVLQ